MKLFQKLLTLVVACTAAATIFTQAGGLPRNLIAADAKWVIYADLERLRASQTGQFLEKRFLTEAYQELGQNMKFDAAALSKRFKSLVAYGNEFKAGGPGPGGLPASVLIIQADKEAQTILTGALAAQVLATDTNSPVKQLQSSPYPLYAIGKDLCAALHPDGVITLGKSRERIEEATEVRAKKRPSLAGAQTFNDFPSTLDGFFLIAAAEGFADQLPFPAQARVLQMSDGARIALDESSDRLKLELSIKGKNAEVVTQIQQVAQGMVALFTMGQPEDADLAELVKSTRVKATEKVVSIGIDFPVNKALARLEESENKEKAPAKVKVKKQKRKARAESADKPAAPASPEKPEAPAAEAK